MSVRLVEEMVLNEAALGCEAHSLKGYRMFRIEYGFECACPEGFLLLPPGVDPDKVECAINGGHCREQDEADFY